MNKIENFLAKNARPDKMKQFEAMTAGKSKEEIRQIEIEMLEPEPIPLYVGEEHRYIVNSEHTVKFIFANQDEMDFFGKHIPISSYIEKSVTDLKIIFDLLKGMDAGEITYEKKTGRFQFNINTIKGETDVIEHPAETELQGPTDEPDPEQPSTPMRRFFNRNK